MTILARQKSHPPGDSCQSLPPINKNKMYLLKKNNSPKHVIFALCRDDFNWINKNLFREQYKYYISFIEHPGR